MAPDQQATTVPATVGAKLDAVTAPLQPGHGRLDLTAAYQPLSGQATAEASVGWRTASGWELGVWGGAEWGAKRDAVVGARVRKEW